MWLRRLISLLEHVIFACKAKEMFTNSFLTNKNRMKGSLNFQAFKVKVTDSDDSSIHDVKNGKTKPFHWGEGGKMALFLAYLNSKSYETTDISNYSFSWVYGKRSLKVLPQYSHDQKYWQFSNHPREAGKALKKKSFYRTEIGRRQTQITQKLLVCKRG